MRTILLTLLMAGLSSAASIRLDTSGLDTSQIYYLDFQLVEFTPGLNQVTVSNLASSAGFLSPFPFTIGGVSVLSNPPLDFLLDGSQFVNDAQFYYSPGGAGDSVSFDVDATSNLDTAGTDTFTFAILDQFGDDIPTTNSNFLNSFVEIDAPSDTTPIQITELSGADPNQTDLVVNAPVVTPEPSAWVLMTIGAVAIAAGRRRRRAH